MRPIRLLLLLGYWRRDRDLPFRTLAGERKSIKANFPFHRRRRCRVPCDAPTHSLAQQPLPYRTTEDDGLHRPHRSLPSPLSPLLARSAAQGSAAKQEIHCDGTISAMTDRPRPTVRPGLANDEGLDPLEESFLGRVKGPVLNQKFTWLRNLI